MFCLKNTDIESVVGIQKLFYLIFIFHSASGSYYTVNMPAFLYSAIVELL